MQSLTDSLDPLIEAFNAASDTPRLLAVVSPTCGPCLDGATAVELALDAFPFDDIAAFIVWIEVLPEDNPKAAREVSARFTDDPRVQQFHDPMQHTGWTLAFGLSGPEGFAWDCYFFYPPGLEWGADPPPPQDWYHQLTTADWADPDRFREGDDLVDTIYRSVGRLLNHDAAF